MTRRAKILLSVLLSAAVCIGITVYAVWTSFFDHTMRMAEVQRVGVEEVPETHPLQLRVRVVPLGSAPVIRKVTFKRQGGSITVTYHLAIATLVKPSQNWHEPYLLMVPDSVNEVRFGSDDRVIWRRGAAAR